MHNTVKRAFLLLFVVGIFVVGTVILGFSFFRNSEEWATHRANAHIYSGGQISAAGTIYDSEGEILAQTKDSKRTYNPDSAVRKATLHAVGDTEGFMSTGVHALFESELTGYNIVSGTYYLEKYGIGNDINLTLDSKVCKTAYNALNGRKGTVGVYNYKTGEIVCMVSCPTYDPENKPDNDTMNSDAYKAAYINKFLSSSFTPGSTFKIVTSACAIENIPDIYERTFDCDGEYEVGETAVICNGKHGKQSFEKALNNSCNSAFAEISIELGKTKLQKTAEKMGLTSSFEVDRVPLSRGTADLSKAVDIDTGWAGIGQYTITANPCMMMTLMGAIANGGTAVEPYYVGSITTPKGFSVYKAKTEYANEISLNADTAEKLTDLLRSNVTDYYGDSSFPDLEMCGKTGTAEVGDDKTGDNAWFAGFSQRVDFPYAIVVLIEDSSSNARQAAIPVANKVLQSIGG
ncbi:MAG: penicillin-binding protein [Ruminococcaceae bacterium]|nr:penicillin-binding protein [Oscillospiraceae bacterium]